MKQTAMQEFVNHLKEYGFRLDEHKIEIENFIEKEKQQIIDAYNNGNINTYNTCESGCGVQQKIDTNSEQYYNQNFKNK